jgi:predicted MPP superfamily phosphohydrolase
LIVLYPDVGLYYMLVRLYDYSPMNTSSESTALTWLHLSDLHFGHGDAEQRFDQKNVTREILEDAGEVAARLGPPDLIIITGDIAFSANPEAEYEPARQWIEKLVKKVGASLDRVLMVPGNHDVDRDRVKYDPNAKTVHEGLRTTPKRLNEFLSKPASMSPLWAKFGAYADFTRRYGAPEVTSESPFWVKTISHPIAPVRVVGLNTSLLSFDDNDAPTNLALSLAQIETTFGSAVDGELVLVLQHHPPGWLVDAHDLEVRLSRRPHLLFCGHVHEAGGTIQKSLRGGQLTRFVAGAGHAEEAGKHHHAWGRLHKDGVDFYPRAWSRENGRFVADKNGFPNANDVGCVCVRRQDLPEPLARWIENRRSVPKPTTPNAPSLAASYDPSRPYLFIGFAPKGDGVVGRSKALAAIRQQLTNGRQTRLGQTGALVGLGGIGKTQIAVEYAYEYQHEYPGGVYWFNADQDIDGQLTRLAASAGWIHPDSEAALKLQVARNRIRTHFNALLIFDNLENFSDVEEILLGPLLHCHLLVTSKTQHSGFETIDLPLLLDEPESLELLTIEAARDLVSDADRVAAQRIAQRFEGLPLALELAGAYLRHQNGVSWTEYADMLDRKGLEAKGLQLEAFNRESLTGHDANLYAALKIDESLFNEAPELRQVLDTLAWCGYAAIGRSLVQAILADTEADALTHALGLAESLHILKREVSHEQAARYRMHRLVKDVRQIEAPLTEGFVATVAERIGQWFETRREDFQSLPSFEEELDHLIAWAGHSEGCGLSRTAVRLRWLEAYPSYHRARYARAASKVEDAL